uniref:Uncharacterized protein n=1 Tax=Arion vulgaris TaxID=1028688 RepID=A0A0B7BHM2_9EUPU
MLTLTSNINIKFIKSQNQLKMMMTSDYETCKSSCTTTTGDNNHGSTDSSLSLS